MNAEVGEFPIVEKTGIGSEGGKEVLSKLGFDEARLERTTDLNGTQELVEMDAPGFVVEVGCLRIG